MVTPHGSSHLTQLSQLSSVRTEGGDEGESLTYVYKDKQRVLSSCHCTKMKPMTTAISVTVTTLTIVIYIHHLIHTLPNMALVM